MEPDRYRSYVVRVWFRGDRTHDAARLVVEEVRSGAAREVRGPAASELYARLEAVLAGDPPSVQSVPATASSAGEPIAPGLGGPAGEVGGGEDGAGRDAAQAMTARRDDRSRG